MAEIKVSKLAQEVEAIGLDDAAVGGGGGDSDHEEELQQPSVHTLEGRKRAF